MAPKIFTFVLVYNVVQVDRGDINLLAVFVQFDDQVFS